MSQQISEDDLNKALANIDQLAKSKAGKTNSTKVEGMSGEGGATQIFHTASNSDPGSWAGSKAEDVPGNGIGVDKISENGTDLRMSKSILAKIAKGQDLTDDEKKFVAKAMKEQDDVEKGMMPPPFAAKGDKDKGDDEDEDDKKKAPPFGKSLAEAATENPKVAPGFEVSDFLKGLVYELSARLDGMEKSLEARLSAVRTEQASMAKSLGAALADIGTVAGATVRKIEAVESGAARAPKSHAASAAALSKSLGGNEGQPLSKALVGDVLDALMEQKKVHQIEVLKFDATGELNRETEQKVRAYLASRA